MEEEKKDAVIKVDETSFINDVKLIINQGRKQTYQYINVSMINTFWLLGKRIVEQEQKGKHRAEYGARLLKILEDELSKEFGSGFSQRNLWYYRQFYIVFPDFEIMNTRVHNLSWSHIRSLLKVGDRNARIWYLNEASSQMWSVRTLSRNISSQYYERLLLSQNKDAVVKEMNNKIKDKEIDNKLEYIKNPFVIEFLGLKSNIDFTETQLEASIISNIQKFLMEMGKGYAFVSRQQHIHTEENDYYIDLVFYNYILKCFVLIDLKTNKITYQDVGQMDMYLQMYDKYKKQCDDNSTIGIILCADTNEDVAKYSTLNKNSQMFASKYKLYLPSKEELKKEIEKQKEIFRLQQENPIK